MSKEKDTDEETEDNRSWVNHSRSQLVKEGTSDSADFSCPFQHPCTLSAQSQEHSIMFERGDEKVHVSFPGLCILILPELCRG